MGVFCTPRGSLSLLLHSLPLHAASETLLVSAVLATIPLAFIYYTILVLPARVCEILPDCPLEEPFAAFTTKTMICRLVIKK